MGTIKEVFGKGCSTVLNKLCKFDLSSLIVSRIAPMFSRLEYVKTHILNK